MRKVKRAFRVRTLAMAIQAYPETVKPWSVRNVSVTGAFLETPNAIPIGTELEVALVFGAMRIHTKARVVRIQEPSWQLPAGVGVEFTALRGDAKQFLETYITASAETSETRTDEEG